MNIVVVDDAELNNLLVVEALRPIAGYEARTFTSPLKALSFIHAETNGVGAVVTDYDMPGMTGVELIKAARAVRGFEHVPMVMVTSIEQRQLRRDALAAGATDFMTKPFDAVEIRARLSNLLALDRARREQGDRAAWLAREVAAAVAEVEAREREIVTRLVRAAEHRDSDTGDHVGRVADYVHLIARGLGLGLDECGRLAFASTMHDIGKIAVPDAVLQKPGPLTPAERAEIGRHVEAGFRILEGSTSAVVRLAADIALTHHERWDGAGYPRGLKGEAIPLGGRVVAVADVFDALTSVRPYKAAWTFDDARAYLLANAGSQFDPACVAAFDAGWPEVLRMAGARAARAA